MDFRRNGIGKRITDQITILAKNTIALKLKIVSYHYNGLSAYEISQFTSCEEERYISK